MAQIDLLLKRLVKENEYTYPEDFIELYLSVNNHDLRVLFAVYHFRLNGLFNILNKDIRYDTETDIFGCDHIKYMGGYFHAQDSRDLLDVLDAIEELKKKCHSTEYDFRLCDIYDDVIRRCRRFVYRSGSNIPEGFQPIDIKELEPVFQLTNSIAISRDTKTIYSELKSIGEGSYARVFCYEDPYYHIPIVVKRAKKELDNRELVRFKTEYKVLKSLSSPYIVEVFGYDDVKNEYTMEYMDETLLDYVKKNNTTLTLVERKKIIAQICRGLSYIHSKKMLHRDISFSNVFIKHYDNMDVVKIGDFGLVKIPDSTLTSLQSEAKGSLNDPDLINVGFANYEMCHEIFALTRLCFFILTGKSNVDNQKSGSIKEFWKKGTNPNREERYKSVEEVAEAVFSLVEE